MLTRPPRGLVIGRFTLLLRRNSVIVSHCWNATCLEPSWPPWPTAPSAQTRLLWRSAVGVVLGQHFAVPAQRPQRGPQVMSDGVGEYLQVLFGQCQFRRALVDPDLELRVEYPDLGPSRAEVFQDADARLDRGLGLELVGGRVLQDVKRQRAVFP